MKKFVFIILGLVLAVYLTGCGKKQQTLEEMQEPMSMEALSRLTTETQTMPESKVQGTPATASVAQEKAVPLPPAGPYKPTGQEIQTALKNAGYYTGLIDGKIGPMTKKAIEEFQKANGLKVDGKVGLQTWSVLTTYLNPAPATKTKKR